MCMKKLLIILLACILFSNQVIAEYKEHNFSWVAIVHEIDNDELRTAVEESAESLREYYYFQKSRKPKAAQN
ncbi:DUF2554 family protein [Escherichia coli]|nr:DUF2554 family protein [Escherichia coli]